MARERCKVGFVKCKISTPFSTIVEALDYKIEPAIES